MKSTLAIIGLFSVLALASPVLAQEGHHEGNHGENHGGQRSGHEGRRGGERGRGRGERGSRARGRRLEGREFHQHFGREHRFRPEWRGGYDAFFFGGYEFGFIDPWPYGWEYTDEVYVDDIDGSYFLLNPRFPGVRVGVIIN